MKQRVMISAVPSDKRLSDGSIQHGTSGLRSGFTQPSECHDEFWHSTSDGEIMSREEKKGADDATTVDVKVVRKIQLAFTPESKELLVKLKHSIGADTYSEVIRRGIFALERFEPIDEAMGENVVILSTSKIVSSQRHTERVHVALSGWSMQRLKALQENADIAGETSSYSEIIRQGLRVLSQIACDLGLMDVPNLNGHTITS